MRIYNLKIERLPQAHLDIKKIPVKNKLPESVDLSLSPNMPPVWDQGSLGSCTAQALVAAFGFIHKPTFMGSRLFLYYNERMVEHDISNDSGASLSDGVKCLKKYGICPEDQYPYVIDKFAKPPPATVYKSALEHKAVSVKNITNSLASMQNALASGFPFVIGISIFDQFESKVVAKTGMVPLPNNLSKLLGGHAVLVVGYDNATSLFKVRNSWGTGWGINGSGYFYLPYKYLLNPRLSTDMWVLTSAT